MHLSRTESHVREEASWAYRQRTNQSGECQVQRASWHCCVSLLCIRCILETNMHFTVAANNQANKLPKSDFYNTMVDYINLMADFESWQSRSG